MVKRRVGGGARPPGQKKPPLTHFLCVPLVTPTSRPQLEASLKTFKEDVSPPTPKAAQEAERAGSKDENIVLPFVHPKSIRPIGTLHCTLGVMSLDADKLTEATSLLQGIDVQDMTGDAITNSTSTHESTFVKLDREAGISSTEEISITPPALDRARGPFKVDLRGLVSMHSANSTSILYSAPADDSGRLLPFCIALQKLFKDERFIVDDRRLKLHATVVNTIYAKGRKPPPRSNFTGQGSTQGNISQGHGPNANAPLKIDATAILEKYRDFAWAEGIVLDRVAICEMGAKKTLDEDGNVKDEEYTEVASIALPV